MTGFRTMLREHVFEERSVYIASDGWAYERPRNGRVWRYPHDGGTRTLDSAAQRISIIDAPGDVHRAYRITAEPTTPALPTWEGLTEATNHERTTMRYHKGQLIYKGNKVHGVVIECDDHYLVVNLVKPTYTGSDMRDDAGIPAGTRVKRQIIAHVQIEGDPQCQAPTYRIIDGTEANPAAWKEPVATLESIDDDTYERLLAR